MPDFEQPVNADAAAPGDMPDFSYQFASTFYLTPRLWRCRSYLTFAPLALPAEKTAFQSREKTAFRT
jgi:hypothetical protein